MTELDRAIAGERVTLAAAELMVVKSAAKLAGLIHARELTKREPTALELGAAVRRAGLTGEPSEAPDRFDNLQPVRTATPPKIAGYSFG